jgi:hypothetical protein
LLSRSQRTKLTYEIASKSASIAPMSHFFRRFAICGGFIVNDIRFAAKPTASTRLNFTISRTTNEKTHEKHSSSICVSRDSLSIVIDSRFGPAKQDLPSISTFRGIQPRKNWCFSGLSILDFDDVLPKKIKNPIRYLQDVCTRMMTDGDEDPMTGSLLVGIIRTMYTDPSVSIQCRRIIAKCAAANRRFQGRSELRLPQPSQPTCSGGRKARY